jgi:magnesium-transporting ATPase (P-type)
MPYGITVGSLTVVFIFIMLGLIYQRRLLPGVVMIGSFILLVLYITGIVETAIQLFGPAGNINGNCQFFVYSQRHNPQYQGQSIATLAWLQQNATCQSWLAVFSFWIIGAVFLTWMIVLGSMVARGTIGE